MKLENKKINEIIRSWRWSNVVEEILHRSFTSARTHSSQQGVYAFFFVINTHGIIRTHSQLLLIHLTISG
jgi:hypothetical protein